ncbi:antibiotic biosynthesis monooxygenase [uncultured Amphritea sp.]|uniref:antibiotic biosynthesis monooxygenase n=1 Tax=uncultured Amphritea sp. TaxID=981605 RepID=UPI00261EAD66|nr:antibiotic biosynthesis monooxygenase [uncultured Amphritea sp.]
MADSCIQKQLTEPGQEGPVTVSISRKAKPGREAEYEAWISGVIDAASEYPGHQGSNVLRPSAATGNRYVLIYRFDTYENCQTWESSELRKEWLDKLEPLIEGEAEVQRGTGLEFWFDLPELPVNKHPSPHKMALVLITVVYVLVIMLNLILAPVLVDANLWLKSAVIVILQVLLMTYLVMPRVTRLLHSWLFK